MSSQAAPGAAVKRPVEPGRAKWLPPLSRPREAPLGNTQVIRPSRSDSGETAEKTPASAIRARLAFGLRPLQRARVAACRTVRTAPAVQLVGRVSPDGTGRLVIRGVSTCGSVHSCPQCVAPILTARSEELQQALDGHRRDRTAIVTLTLRHHAGVPLRVLRTLLGQAWSRVWSGSAGQRLKRQLSCFGHIRSAEQTYGDNGWHPHLHCLLFFGQSPPPGWEAELTDRWLRVVRQAYSNLWDTCLTAEREHEDQNLREKVARTLGEHVARSNEKRRKHCGSTLAQRAREFRRGLMSLGGVGGVLPDEEHAVTSELCTTGAASRYLAKMGCELTGVLSKSAKPGHHTHWQIGQLAADGHEWSQKLWCEHAAAMLGARQLTWSRGLRERLGLAPERPDELLASETLPEPCSVDTPLAELDGPLWDLFAKQRRQLWLAELHLAYADGSLDITLDGPSGPARQAPAPKPAWWNEELRWGRAREGGAARFARASCIADTRDEQRERPHMTRAEREELCEELSHHLLIDHEWLQAQQHQQKGEHDKYEQRERSRLGCAEQQPRHDSREPIRDGEKHDQPSTDLKADCDGMKVHQVTFCWA